MPDLPHLSIEDVRALAELERLMDRGEVPYVIWHGGRVSAMPEVMEELGLKIGQTISDPIFVAMNQCAIRHLEIELRKHPQ